MAEESRVAAVFSRRNMPGSACLSLVNKFSGNIAPVNKFSGNIAVLIHTGVHRVFVIYCN
jgi:hypothetical protein